MPPKKKALTGAAAAKVRDATSHHDAHVVAGTPKPPLVRDNWTDEQEITLFKAIIRWKPAGVHKHFRMLSIAQLMKNHGVADTHTNIPGIWTKLESLYNLEAVDEQEDSDEDEKDFETIFQKHYEDEMTKRRYKDEPSPPTTDGEAVTKTPEKGSERKKRTRGGSTKKVPHTEDNDTEDDKNSSAAPSPESTAPPEPTTTTKRRGRPPKAATVMASDNARSKAQKPAEPKVTRKQLRPRGKREPSEIAATDEEPMDKDEDKGKDQVSGEEEVNHDKAQNLAEDEQGDNEAENDENTNEDDNTAEENDDEENEGDDEEEDQDGGEDSDADEGDEAVHSEPESAVLPESPASTGLNRKSRSTKAGTKATAASPALKKSGRNADKGKKVRRSARNK